MERQPFDPTSVRGPHQDNSDVGQRTEALAEQVIGAAIEVHRTLGPGLPEAVYEEALCHEMQLRAIPFLRQRTVRIEYKGKCVGERRLDVLVDELLVVELKSVDSLLPVHTSQAICYLRVTGLRRALLINFNVHLLKDGLKRVLL